MSICVISNVVAAEDTNSTEIAVTDELEWTEDGALGIKSVDFAKISSPMDLGEF